MMNTVENFCIAICLTIFLNTVLASSLHRRSDEENVCETEICKESAIRLQNSMNKSVDPCTNFYEYACGGWIASHPIPASDKKYTAFEEVKDKVFKQVKDVLSSPPAKSTTSKSIGNAQSLYRGCLDNDAREKEGVRPVKEFLDMHGGWPLLNPNEWDGSNYKWPDEVAHMIRKLFLDALLVLLPSEDFKNPDYNIIFIDQPDFKAGRNEMFNMTESDRTIEIIAAYKAYIIKSAELLGAEVNDDLKQAVDDLVNFESSLAKFTRSSEERRDISSLYNKMTVAELQKIAPDSIDWKTFINTILEGYTPVEDSTELIVAEVNYLKQMLPLVKSTDIKTVANYIGWKVVAKTGPHSTSAFREAEFQFDKAVKGIEEIQALDKTCVTETTTVLGYAVGRLYVEKYFGNEAKADIENLVKNLRKAFTQTLSETAWMDDDTKKQAIEKLEAMNPMLAYPDWIVDDKKLDEHYEDIPELSDKTYFKSILAATEGMFADRFKKWNKETNRKTEWIASPSEVDAFYNPLANTITFPAGILNVPFYQYNRLPSMNYGAVGMAIGHELSHGFDDQGSQFDKDGNFKDWWTNETRSHFDEKAKCFQDQYSSYVEPTTGLNLNGENTLGENIADNGAIRNAYKAYKLYLEETGNVPQHLPNIDATPDQLFYLSFASIWCGSERTESLQQTIQYDYHSPENYRVMVTLSNTEDFAKAFNCDGGAPMNTAQKCILW